MARASRHRTAGFGPARRFVAGMGGGCRKTVPFRVHAATMVRLKPLTTLLIACILQTDGAPAVAEEAAPGGRISTAYAQSTCRILEEEAVDHGLPPSFFARLIWRESLFNPNVVSPKGAQGIAQFMPGTALERRLADPFDATTALPESAKYLAELKARFGSLGLAAAAYNAGPGRVAAWLGGRSTLPLETQDYVLWITGHSAEVWSTSKSALAVLPIADGLSFTTACRKLAVRGLTARLPDRSLRASGWQAIFISGLGIQQVKASKPGRVRVVIDPDAARRTPASREKTKPLSSR